MSLEKKVNKTVCSFLAGAVLATHLFTSACTSSREYLGKEWVPSAIPVQKEVIDSKIDYREEKSYQLGDIIIDYDGRQIEIAVNEEIMKYSTRTEKIKATKFEEEVQKERIKKVSVDKERFKIGLATAGFFGGIGLLAILLRDSAINKDFPLQFAGVMGSIGIVSLSVGCFPKSYYSVLNKPTHKHRPLESISEKKTELSPEVLQSLPVEKGYIKVEGEIAEGKYQISNGLARFKVSPEYPLLFTPNWEGIKGQTDLSWLSRGCQNKSPGLYAAKHAEESTTKLKVTVEGPWTYLPAEKTYVIPVFRGPSKEKVRDFCEE